MWGLALFINSILLALAGLFLVYSFGAAFILWAWKEFFVALIVFIFFSLAQVALAALNT